MKLPAYKAGHQKGNSNLSWGNISPKPPERAIHPRAEHGLFWQNCIKETKSISYITDLEKELEKRLYDLEEARRKKLIKIGLIDKIFRIS